MLHHGFRLTMVGALTVALTLVVSSANGYNLPRSDDPERIPEPYDDSVQAFSGTEAETAWMVTAIIFIVLFAVSIIVCIYLWYLRAAKVKELRHMHNIRAGVNKDNQNVWYGGGAHM